MAKQFLSLVQWRYTLHWGAIQYDLTFSSHFVSLQQTLQFLFSVENFGICTVSYTDGSIDGVFAGLILEYQTLLI